MDRNQRCKFNLFDLANISLRNIILKDPSAAQYAEDVEADRKEWGIKKMVDIEK